MDCFGFGINLMHWVDFMYGDVEDRILTKGHLLGTIAVTSGIRQGCPMSSVIFLLCMCLARGTILPRVLGTWKPWGAPEDKLAHG